MYLMSMPSARIQDRLRSLQTLIERERRPEILVYTSPMGEIAELRRLLQDLIAPDLKAILVGLKASETLAEARYQITLAKLGVEARGD
jgi:hypothetical protein